MIVRLLVLALLWAAPSPAQDMRALARQKFDEGRLEFAEGRFDKALSAFKESYQLAPYPDLLFNIARCEAELGHYRAALDAYERYLAMNPRDEEARRRAEDVRALVTEEPPAPPTPSPTPSPLPLLAPTAPAPPTPVYRQWWLWTAVVGVAAVAVGVGLGVGLSGAEPRRTFPPLSAQ